jgi:hypothetical protein
MKYSEYFEINQNYYPEINPDSVKDPENKWQFTYPHKTFIELLEAAERMLAREAGKDKHGIWVEGSYGTGKSRVVWALENLLTCSAEEVYQYFGNFDSLGKKPDLRDKLIAHKEGRIITVSRYGSGEIESIKQLIMAVYDSVTKTLKNAKIDYKGQHTLRGRIAAWLEDETHKQIFELLIKKPEYRGLGSFNGKSVDVITEQLKNVNVSADILLDDLLGLADKEGITMFEINMDDLKQWLTDIIDENGLKAIVFFWDEFSSFFKNNKTSLDIFQKLAELSESKPFYMVIVTHMSGSLVGPAEQGPFKIVYDRFVHNTIEMPDGIAFDLIHDAMRIKEVAKDEYEELTEELNGYMTSSRKAVCEQAQIYECVMRDIFPIHPMAALLLKHISTSFASNQRSMFNFIKNNDSDNLQAFQWFINNHSPEDSQILTIDHLWNFFYEKGTDENSSSAGRSNLDTAIATILDTYPSNESKLGSSDEKRVLKTVLMMQAISKKLNNGVELFRPTDKNIQLAFEGDDSMENNRAINIIRNLLVPKKILYIDSDGSVDEYAAAAVAGDQVQIDSIKERLRKETKTATLLAASEIDTAFNFLPSIKARYAFTNVTVDNFTSTINKISNEHKTYQFRAVICYARNEDEQKKMHTLIEEAVKKDLYQDIVFVDASSNVMGVERFDRYIDVAAQEEYWRPKDGKLADDKLKNKKDLLGEWKTYIGSGSFVIYKTENYKTPCGSMQLLNDTLAAVVLKVYPLSFDNAKVSESFFIGDKYSVGAKNGIASAFGGIYQEKSVRAVLGDVLGIANYWEVNGAQSISKLKKTIDELITGKFGNDVRISIGEIFDFLMEQGFMPCNLYAYLTGFLLREYSDEPYRYGIGIAGDDGGKMTAEKLGDYIGEYIKHKTNPIKNYKEKYIEIMTQDQKAFVDFAHDAFGIADNLSVEQTASRVRVKLKDTGYPIWCFKYIDTNSLDGFIDKLADISNAKAGENVPALAGQLGKMLIQVPTASNNLAELITQENGPKAMMEFLQGFENGEILSVAAAIGIPDVMSDVKRQIGSGEASWLWDKDTGVEELKNLLVDYKIILNSNGFPSVSSSTSFFSCMQSWKEYASFIKTPYSVCKAKIPELSFFFECLKNITDECDLSHDKHTKFLYELETKTTVIAALKERKMDIFREEYSLYITGFSEKEIAKLYSKLPNSSFTDDKATFEKNISTESEAIKSEQERFKLVAMWDELTGTTTPFDWCDKNRTPIRVMVPSAEQQSAAKLFNAVNYANADKKDVTFALDYISKKPAFIAELNDRVTVDTAFNRHIIGRYATVLTDIDEVRKHLEKYVPESYYQWYGSPTVSSEIKKLARSKYLNGGNSSVMKKIDGMSADEAKQLLKALVTDDVEVGISIISKEGE